VDPEEQGYFLAWSKPAGFISHPWTFRPSDEENHNSSASETVTSSSTSRLTSTSTFMSDGRAIGNVTSTPGSLTLERTAAATPARATDTIDRTCAPSVILRGVLPGATPTK